VRGKLLYRGDEKLFVRGITYGTFRPNGEGESFPSRDTVERDFARMAESEINAVRTYTPPPRWLFDCAERNGLLVLVGLAWPQHVAFLDDPALTREIEKTLIEGVRATRGHAALLGYSIGNEIPSTIVRWYGRGRIERFLRRLSSLVKQEQPDALVTYVNYPTTEYLELPFLDFCAFNVYLESRTALRTYLARLQNLAGEKPLVMAEIGLDSRRHGEGKQAEALEWQIRASFEAGCAGTFAFSWTDEWHRGGHDIEDWDFGVTTRERAPKQGLSALKRVYSRVPLELTSSPRMSVVVCTYNGAATLRQTLEVLSLLDYPNYEVIVVDDGSTDDSAEIAGEFEVRAISTGNRGLSHARNVGMRAATGEIIAYIDDDAYPDRDWLHYLSLAFESTAHVGIGGPNIVPPEDCDVAQCVACAPGGPCHVLVSDEVAEHIPGCNMAFRKRALQAIGGFDEQFRVAGDDVDVCWRLQARGWTIGFSPGALVWHHRRSSVRKYLKQQVGYGKAEAILERKWPHRFNSFGHVPWGGRIYGRGLTPALFSSGRIYQGTWGSAPFQSLYEPSPGKLRSLPLLPEWWLLVGSLGVLTLLGVSWGFLYCAAPLFMLGLLAPIIQAVRAGIGAQFVCVQPKRFRRWQLAALVAALHLLQPLSRLIGRQRHGLTPWRLKGAVTGGGRGGTRWRSGAKVGARPPTGSSHSSGL
jgi:GT2 family glycosyltransferase